VRILVYPHDLNMGGSQTNAVELAGAVRDLGHECVVFGRPGVLSQRIAELGLEFIESPLPGRRPSVAVIRDLRRTVREREFDIVHGYEWPPGLEAYAAAAGLQGATAVCTVMSMAVAPFLPRSMPLIVGTQQIAAHEMSLGRTRVEVLEPPVDLSHNQTPPASVLASFRRRWGLDGRPLVVCVSRLADEMKSEGILTAIEVVGSLAEDLPCQLMIVGDGPAREVIRRAAERVNLRTGSSSVILTGELMDPRPAYGVADVALGMGGSALRSLAFATPLVVQGESGYFSTLGPETVSQFRWQGWYGVGNGSDQGQRVLELELRRLLSDASLRRRLGEFGRGVVADFALTTAAERQVGIYREALANRSRAGADLVAAAHSGIGLAGYKVRRKVARVQGASRSDDFNTNPVAATSASHPATTTRAPMSSEGPIVYLPGVAWSAVPGTDHHLAAALTRHREVIWVDPPESMIRRRPQLRGSRVSHPAPGMTLLKTVAPPGVSRPIVRDVARRLQVGGLENFLRAQGIVPSAIVATSSEPMLAATRHLLGTKVYFATDDFVAAAPLWGMSPQYLARAREGNLKAADLVLAVTPALAELLRRGTSEPVWFPNGADVARYREISEIEPAAGVRLEGPIAGVVGQFNERTDLSLLHAIAQAGISLLLVGPRSFATRDAAANFEDLARMPGVQWVDRVPSDALPGYLRAMSVGLTAYADSAFNRRSYPLKTVEYLAAGIPVVSTRVAPLDGFNERFVKGATGAEEFVTAVRTLLAQPHPAAAIQLSVRGCGWDVRADVLMAMLTEGGEA